MPYFKQSFNYLTEHDPEILCTATPTTYLKRLKVSYLMQCGNTPGSTRLCSWIEWAGSDIKTGDFAVNQEKHRIMDLAQYRLESRYLKKTDHLLMPIVEEGHIRNRFRLIAKQPVSVLSIIDSTNWPFPYSLRTSVELKAELEHRLSMKLKKKLIEYIDEEINDIIQDQVELAKELEEYIHLEWEGLWRHNRVIGLTADFAAAHQDWLSSLGICAVIVDEASEILESTLMNTHAPDPLIWDNVNRKQF
ncbi:uncharacterized protein EV154DRAFT_582048 [Mucor mucedo]|uniref:uncharacterized protein n=1 Tax=Mucor mucedo TaxID=29922 RepID=UPI00221FD7F7|nr:uncharacterized protein EV154DRAFT_582048 [Mucor mucedo]KAI7893795.1 hypothetical protein EV154DRAFT_582048 [Mucor mucedo]